MSDIGMSDAPMSAASLRCPATAASARPSVCPEAAACRAAPADTAMMPPDGLERVVMLALRFVAAATDTGDAACWDAAFDRAEAECGPRGGALLVARAAALLRALRRESAEVRFLPPPCRRLSCGEAELLAALRAGPDREGRRPSGVAGPVPGEGPLADLRTFPETLGALADLVPLLPSRRAPMALPTMPPTAGRRPTMQPIL